MTEIKPPIAISSPSPTVLVTALPTGAVEIWLNRPERLNAMGMELLGAMEKVVTDAVAGGAAAIFIRAKGRSFCAGADLKERLAMPEPERYRHNRAINAVVNAVAAAPVPTIAVINGIAMGGGLELALACDLRIAAESAQIGLTEARIGGIPGAGGTQRLPRLIGLARALKLMYTGEPVTGREARELGIVNDCVPDDQLDAAAARYVEVLGSRSAATARILKRVVLEGIKGTLADGLEQERQGLAEILKSPDYAEGIAAFSEKRPPRFSR